MNLVAELRKDAILRHEAVVVPQGVV
jgi:hypothetical protein